MADNHPLPPIPHPATLFQSDPVDTALAERAAETPESVAFANNFPPFPTLTVLGSLDGPRTAYKWAQNLLAFHGMMAGSFVQGRMIEAANAMDTEKYQGWQAIGAALWEMTRGPNDDDVMH